MEPVISIIVPVLNEQSLISVFYQAIQYEFKKIPAAFELIFVDDGSSDQTALLVQALHQQDKRVKLISFSRNFGKELALTAGLRLATGDAVIPMDVDFQDPPALLPSMVARWLEGHRVVLAKRIRRADGRVKKMAAWLFYKIFNKISDTRIPEAVGDFRLLDRQVVDEINGLGEHHRLMKGLFAWVGFAAAVVEYERPKEQRPDRRMGFKKLWTLAKNGLFSFSDFPMACWTYCGLSLMAVGACAAMVLGVRWFRLGVLSEVSFLLILICFLSGLQFLALGVMGQYVVRVYDEVKNRPLYIISKKLGL